MKRRNTKDKRIRTAAEQKMWDRAVTEGARMKNRVRG